MTNQPNEVNDREVIEDEMDDLDIPMVMIDAILMVMGDHFDIDPLTYIDAYIANDLDDLRTAHGSGDIALMGYMIDEALESTTQLPHIRRAIELNLMLNTLG